MDQGKMAVSAGVLLARGIWLVLGQALVREYIASQETHHRKITFQQELRDFFKRHQIEYDERYVWD